MTILGAVGQKPEARSVVETAYDLAEAYNDDVVVLHVIPEEKLDESNEHIMGLPFYDSFDFSRDEEGAAQFASKVVEAVIPERDSGVVTTRGRVGDVVTEITAEAEEINPRYIVIGGRRRSPVGKAAFGDTTQKVLLNSNDPVVTLMSE